MGSFVYPHLGSINLSAIVLSLWIPELFSGFRQTVVWPECDTEQPENSGGTRRCGQGNYVKAGQMDL